MNAVQIAARASVMSAEILAVPQVCCSGAPSLCPRRKAICIANHFSLNKRKEATETKIKIYFRKLILIKANK